MTDADLEANSEDMPTPLRGPLLTALARSTGDPDVAASLWISQGAPIGIDHDIPVCGVFPAVDPTSCRNGEETWPLRMVHAAGV